MSELRPAPAKIETVSTEFLRLSSASKISDVSARSLRRAIASGSLQAFRPGSAPRGLILVRRSDLIRWIEAGRIANGGRDGRRSR